MSKGGSDLDVFGDLAKKRGEPASSKAPPPPPMRQKTLVGLQAPVSAAPSRPVPSAPPPPPSRAGGPPSGGAARPPSSAGAPPTFPGAAPRAAQAQSVEMDWDDDDEKTTVYDREGNEDAAQALLASAPPVPAPAPPPSIRHSGAHPIGAPVSAPAPPPPTRPANRAPTPGPGGLPPVASMHAPHQQAYPGMGMAPPRDRRTMIYAAILVVAVAAAAVFLLLPRSGSIIVTVSGPGNKPLDSVEVVINGELKCSSSPCTISGLAPDTYMLRARAIGYQPMADTAIAVVGGQKAVHNLTLVRAAGTGMKVIAEGDGLKLFVDGKEVGPLPQELKDMEPGEHVIKVAGNDRFEPFEKTITVQNEQMQTIGPLKLKVVKGLASIVPGPGAEDARVLLVSGNDRRTLPKLPINLDIPTNRPHTITATKRGYGTFRKAITFEDGKAEKTFEVTMVEVGEAPSPAPRAKPTSMGSPRPAPRPTPGPAATSGAATLNINSIPVSNIILDGRPMGPTPKVGVRVGAGSHTIVFISGSDRKAATVNVSPGQTKTVAVRF